MKNKKYANLQMTFQDFKSTLSSSHPPEDLPDLLKAMWYEGNNNWDRAHNIAQDISSAEGSWIHAYLHRKEGDHGNAAYWYSRAGRPVPRITLDKEWEEIVTELLQPLR